MSITSEELAKTIRRELHFTPTESEALALASALGLEVEDPKPEPGTWHFTKDGDVSRMVYDGMCDVFYDGGAILTVPHDDTLTVRPARVVPAEPVELTEDEAERLFNEGKEEAGHLARWSNYTDEAREHFLLIMNAALAKYGHGVA